MYIIVEFLHFVSTLNVYKSFVILYFYKPLFLNERYVSYLSYKKKFAYSGRINLRPHTYIGTRRSAAF